MKNMFVVSPQGTVPEIIVSTFFACIICVWKVVPVLHFICFELRKIQWFWLNLLWKLFHWWPPSDSDSFNLQQPSVTVRLTLKLVRWELQWHNFQSAVTIVMKFGTLRMYINSGVNIFVGELTVIYVYIHTYIHVLSLIVQLFVIYTQ